jgi:hypothetical protein
MVVSRGSLLWIGIFHFCLSSCLVHAFTSSSSTTTTSWQQGIQNNYHHAFVNKSRNDHAISRSSPSCLRRDSLGVPSICRTRRTTTTTSLKAIMDIVGTSPEPIHTAFAFATFGPQPFWLLLIFLPKQEITRKIMGKLGVYTNIWLLFC